MKRKILLIFLVTLLCFFVAACDTTQTESSSESSGVSIESNDSSADSSDESTPDESTPDESIEDLSLWFDEFTSSYFSSSELTKKHGVLAKDIMFNEQHGYAIQYPSFENEKSDAEIENVIALLKSEFDTFTSALETPTVLCVDYSSELNGSYGNVIFNVEYVSKNDEILKSFILTRCFDNSGEVITTETLFRDSYREIVRDEMLLIFAKNEEVKAQFSEHDIESITNDSDSLGEFVLYDDSVDFLFLNADGTIVAMTLPKIDIRTAFIDITSIPRKLDPTKKMIALTYDDGPDRSNTNRILDVMEKYGAVATFFELGELVKGRESVLQREVSLGCEVGSHSWEHLNMLKHSLEHLKRDKEMTDKAFKNALGYPPKLFRPPYGNTNDAICEMYNMVVIGWTLDTLDWQKVDDGGRKDVDALFNYFVAKHEAGKLDGQVALMHSIYSTTAEATERIVPYLLDNGYQLVTVSELITYKLGQEVTPGVRYYSGYIIRDNKDCND